MMASLNSQDAALSALIAGRKAGFSLERDFYTDESVYRVDVERIWRRGWLFAGHSCEIPNPGDYFALEVDSDPILVIRGDDKQVRALHNVCRHRGSLICPEAAGHVSWLVCPYHQWTYDRSGALVGCRGALEDLDKTQFGLRSVNAREVEGLIYICLAEQPPNFEPARDQLASLAKPQGFPRAKVAQSLDYTVRANWKLVWENNRECYHCNVNHPQYIRANFDHYNTDDTSPRIQQAMEAAVRRSEQKWAASGLAATHQTPKPTWARFASARCRISGITPVAITA